jgi:DNA transposition AAA+ family ATPase
MNECLTTQQEHLLTCLLGEAGHGKTTALTSFFQSNPHVYYVNLQFANTKRDMIETIAQALTLDTDASISQLVKRIAAKLNSAKDSLLIIDEISITKEYTINYLRDIRDRTRHNAGMLLAGCPYFKSNLEKSVRRGKQGIPEFVSRVGLFLNLSVPSKEEKEAICRANGIDEPLVIKSLTGCKDYRELETAIMRIMNKKPNPYEKYSFIRRTSNRQRLEHRLYTGCSQGSQPHDWFHK